MNIGFIGAGRMGHRMIANLLRGGHRVHVLDESGEARDRIWQLGAKTTNELREVVVDKDAIFTMLPTPAVSVSLYEGSNGLFASTPTGTLLVESSTVDVQTIQRLGVAAREYEAEFVDAPLTGGIEGAEAGTLTFMVGGTSSQIERLAPALDSMGRKTVHAGPFASGTKLKLINNMICAANLMVAAEALTLGLRLGLDPMSMYEVISSGTGSSWVLNTYYPLPGVVPGSPASRSFENPTFPAIGMAKDMRCALDAARSVGAITPLHSVAEDLLRLYCQHFDQNLDWTAVSTMFGARDTLDSIPDCHRVV